MNRNLRKMLRRSIKATFGRYVAILAIVALGVGFFAGLKSSEPAMSGTADEYLKAQNMYDFQLMSSLGITEGDVDAFNALDYVIGAEGAYSLDVLLQRGDKQDAFKFHSITDEVCVPVLVEGRMPENAGECLADALVFKSEDIGTKLKIALGNEEDTVDMLRYGSYTIVGIAKTPRYISAERGSTHLGSGSISGFVLLREDGFDSEAYHELLVQCDINEKSFTDEYNSVRDSMESDIKTFFNERGALRYKELRAEADEEIADARKELDDGWQEYYDGEKEGQKKLEDAAYELYLAQEKIDEGRKEIEKGQQEIDNAKQSLPGTISMLKAQIQSAQTDRENNTKALEELLLEKAQELAPLQAELDAKQAVLDALLADENADDATVEQAQAELAAAQQNLADKTSAFAEKETQLQTAIGTAQAKEKMFTGYLEQAQTALDELPANQATLDSSKATLDYAQYEVNKGWLEYHDGKAEYQQELADALIELEDGEKELADAIKDVEEELQLDLYTLTRDENSGCATFRNDIGIVDAIANVFPVFFALIAALVCSTTMTRMVTEERTQIGTLKALGYSSGSIMSKYLCYSGSSAFIGCVLGFAMGVTVIPFIVWKAYGILYDYAKLEFYYSIEMCLGCMAFAVLGTLLVTWYACRKELAAKPAELIRPKVEGKGKRVFIEYIKPLWKRLSFLNKVTIRNALRYKSRVFMMLLGIGGCTALLVTGFGIRDSVVNVLADQYEDIFTYDLTVKYEPDDFDSQTQVEALWKDKASYAMTYQVEATLTTEADEKTAQLVAAAPGSLEGMIALFNDEGEIAYPEAGYAVITTRIAQQLDVQPGDAVQVRTGDGMDSELIISAITENYVGNYVYVHPETAGNMANNTAILVVNEGEAASALGAHLRSEEGVDYVSIMEQEKKMMSESMSSLDLVVLLLIVCSGALAFITLYNLTNINLLERVREVATVKVLGFYHKETASYILRENVMLSFLGAAVGMGLGKLFHSFVISLLQVEGMCFGDEIALLSYALGFVMTIFFAWICNLSMHGKLKRVNMTESLKSVE